MIAVKNEFIACNSVQYFPQTYKWHKHFLISANNEIFTVKHDQFPVICE